MNTQRVAVESIRVTTSVSSPTVCARGLRAMVETLLKDVMFEAPDGMIKSVTVEVEDGELHISREMKDELKLA